MYQIQLGELAFISVQIKLRIWVILLIQFLEWVLLPDNFILVTIDVMALYLSTPHNTGLKALRDILDKSKQKKNFY